MIHGFALKIRTLNEVSSSNETMKFQADRLSCKDSSDSLCGLYLFLFILAIWKCLRKAHSKGKKGQNFYFFLTLFSFSDLESTVFSKMEDVIKILILNPQINL